MQKELRWNVLISKMSYSEKSSTMQNFRFTDSELQQERPSTDNLLAKYLNTFRTNEISTEEYKEYVQHQSDQIQEINVKFQMLGFFSSKFTICFLFLILLICRQIIR